MIATSEEILVAYFSHTGNTRKIAHQIHKKNSCALFEIKPVNAYPDSYSDVLVQAKHEIQSGTTPLLKEKIADINKYKLIFLGYPNWWHTLPAPVLSFLKSYNFSGKIIAPFCTHGGGGIGQSVADINKHCPQAKLLQAFSINSYSVTSQNNGSEEWSHSITNSFL